MFKIGEFSKISRETIKTLRYYDSIKLLVPQFICPDSGYRYYHHKQLFTISIIQEFKDLGFSLKEIGAILNGEVESEVIEFELKRKRDDIESSIIAEQRRLKNMDAFIDNFKQDERIYKMEKVVLKEIPTVKAATMRTTIKNYDQLFSYVPEMGKMMGFDKVICAEPFYCFNIYHDDEYKIENIDVEVCEAIISFPESQHPNSKVIYKEIEGIKLAAAIDHKGDYSTLVKSYGKLYKWIEDNSYKAVGSPRESFIDGCWNKESSDHWLTEIQIPVEKV